VRIVEAVRLVVRDGDALPTAIVIVTEWDSDPFEAITVTVKVPLAEDGQDKVDVPEPEMLIGESGQESPVDGDAVDVRPTCPTNPLTLLIVKVESPAVPTVTLMAVGPAVIVKSWMVNVMVAVRDLKALAPVTLTWTVAAEAKVQDRVALPDPVMLVGETLHEVLFVIRFTVPVKPLIGATVMVEVPADPTFRVTAVGLAVMAKSVTVNVIVAVCDRLPLVPVTVTV
jgi:hypothetical protein